MFVVPDTLSNSFVTLLVSVLMLPVAVTPDTKTLLTIETVPILTVNPVEETEKSTDAVKLPTELVLLTPVMGCITGTKVLPMLPVLDTPLIDTLPVRFSSVLPRLVVPTTPVIGVTIFVTKLPLDPVALTPIIGCAIKSIGLPILPVADTPVKETATSIGALVASGNEAKENMAVII